MTADQGAPVASTAVLDRARPLIVLRRAWKTFTLGDAVVHALRDVSLTVREGDLTAIMGPSGSGKSTLMNVIGCLDQPDRGRYLLQGLDVRRLPERQLAEIRNRTIGFVFQGFNLIARTPALENVELPLVYAGVARRERRRRAAEVLERLGLADRLRHQPSELSGGQQQRVAIARALVTNPSVLLADEPTGALDSASSAGILRLFSEINAQGRTVVVITHEPEVATYAKRVVRLSDGAIVEEERRAEVRDLPPRLGDGEWSGGLAA